MVAEPVVDAAVEAPAEPEVETQVNTDVIAQPQSALVTEADAEEQVKDAAKPQT